MSGRLPPDAFDFYLSLGSERSYQTVADKYGVSKQSVTKLATREKWQQRIAAIEAKARANTDARAVETLEEINERCMKMWKLVEARAIEAVRDHPLASGAEGFKALDYAHKNMRLIRGEPTDRTENIEHVIRREYERWMRPVEADSKPDAGEEDKDASADATEKVEDDEGADDDADDAV